LAKKIVVLFQHALHASVSRDWMVTKQSWVRIKGNAEETGTKYYLSTVQFDTAFKLQWSNERCNFAHLIWRLEKCWKISQIILKWINNPVFFSDTIRVHLQVTATYQSRYPDETTTSNRTERRFHSANTAITLNQLRRSHVYTFCTS
jgi:hypothetical protein